MKKKALAFLLAALTFLSLPGLRPVSVRAESGQSTAGETAEETVSQVPEWSLVEDGPYRYLSSSLMTGMIQAANGDRYYAFLHAYLDEDVFLFRTFSNAEGQEGIMNRTDSLQRQSALVMTESGVFTQVDVIFLPNSDLFYLDPLKTVGGMTVNQLIETDLRTGGTTTLILSTNFWNAHYTPSYCMCHFTLTADSAEFRSLLKEAEDQQWGNAEGNTRTEIHEANLSSIDCGWRKLRAERNEDEQLDSCYLSNFISGYALYPDGRVSKVIAMANEDSYGFYLQLASWNGNEWAYLTNKGDTLPLPVQINTSSGESLATEAYLYQESSIIELSTSEIEGALSAEDLLENELYQKGAVELQISIPTSRDDGQEAARFLFTIPACDGAFSSLMQEVNESGWAWQEESLEAPPEETEAPTEPAKAASVYSDETIETICTDYLNTFNYAVPICAQLYDTLTSDSAGLMDYALALIGGFSSYQALEDFYYAKKAFDGISYDDLTNAQKTLYTQAKTAVDSTTAGQIIKLVQTLYDLGLL